MCGIDKRVEILRRTVGRVRGIQQHAVVAPAAGSAKLGNGHDFDLGYAELGKIRQLIDSRPEGAFRGKRADVQFVNDRLFPGPSCPFPVNRLIAPGIDNNGGAVNVALLRARGRVGHRHAVLQDKLILCTVRDAVHVGLEPAAARCTHRHIGGGKS